MKNKRKPIKTTKRNIIDYWIQYIDECGMNFDWAEADTICWRCGCERKLQRCHIIPDSLGGKDEPSNFVLLCAECHQEAPNVEDKQFMWDWIKSFYSPFYNTFWQTRAFEEYKRIYKKSYSDELKDRNITTDHALIEFRNLKHGRTSYHFGHPFGNVATIAGNYKMILDAFDQKYPSRKYKTDEEILKAAISIEEAGIPRVSCSGGYGYKGKQAVNATEIVKSNTSLEILVNVGGDLTEKSINKLADLNADTVCCNLETINEDVFNFVKPGETLNDRIETCQGVSDAGIELSSGLLVGLGESLEDRIAHLRYLNNFETLGEIPIMGFNPYKDTPMANHPPSPLEEQLKIMAVTRIMYPEIRITVPTPTIGPKNVEYSLNAGANNLATVIADNYPLEVKGVGSPVCGNYDDVVSVINKLGLTPQTI